ncbi:glycosyltransferase family 9 protein [Sodalis sp. dw_96]|uniref:glycosyltransferase family 9 protein n=1 Tax=Sodalis sp. dw_96 TaxID=2719794 RepID=UPI001BD26C77|nr:glycosyltransferase family 9 protein [Sodalis sp. dw_96]
MKVLVICRDNIGDTILTTPLMSALSETLHCQVDVLVNSYNAEVLKGNPHISKTYSYTKTHHRNSKFSVIRIILSRIKLLFEIKKAGYDVAIIGKGTWDKRALHWAAFSKAKRIIALGKRTHPKITDLIPQSPSPYVHFVDLFHHMLEPLDISSRPGRLELYADAALIAMYRQRYGVSSERVVIALQISSRKVTQRWPAESFIQLAVRIAKAIPCQLLLLWSPGHSDNPRHPGDDEKAHHIAEACKDLPIIPIPTVTLSELFAAMSLCDLLVSSDGGAMHVGAALGKPTVALFGDSDPGHWAPWHVPHKILQNNDQDVRSISVDTVFIALENLLEQSSISLKQISLDRG